MADIQSQLPVKITDGTNTTAIVGTALKVDGSAVTQPVSGSVSVSNFPSTQNIAGTGTAGTAATGVVTVQGIAGAVAVKVDGSAVTQPVSGTVAVSSVSGTVAVSFGETSSGIVNYASSSTAVANGATGTITYTVTAGKTLYLKGILAASSGAPCKVVVDYGATPTILAVGFYSSAMPYFHYEFPQPVAISASTAVNVKITNNAGSAQDVYATINGHEV